jgi:hypothetical protein
LWELVILLTFSSFFVPPTRLFLDPLEHSREKSYVHRGHLTSMNMSSQIEDGSYHLMPILGKCD